MPDALPAHRAATLFAPVVVQAAGRRGNRRRRYRRHVAVVPLSARFQLEPGARSIFSSGMLVVSSAFSRSQWQPAALVPLQPPNTGRSRPPGVESANAGADANPNRHLHGASARTKFVLSRLAGSATLDCERGTCCAVSTGQVTAASGRIPTQPEVESDGEHREAGRSPGFAHANAGRFRRPWSARCRRLVFAGD